MAPVVEKGPCRSSAHPESQYVNPLTSRERRALRIHVWENHLIGPGLERGVETGRTVAANLFKVDGFKASVFGI